MAKKGWYDSWLDRVESREYEQEELFDDWKGVAGAIAVGAVLCASSLYIRPFCMTVFNHAAMCDAYQSDLPSFIQK